MQLITEKISIPNERPRLLRTRLINLLRNSMDNFSATIISGRTGMGKTMLTADFARQCGRAVAWYRVDAADKEPHVFFTYLFESLQRHGQGYYRAFLTPLPTKVEEEDLFRLAESVIYELQEAVTEPLLVVIEDLHLVYDEPWVVPFFTRFIPLLPENIHLFIVARSVIPVPLWRMRSKQKLLTVDEQTLAFTREEAVRLFAGYGLDERQAVDVLYQSRGRASLVDDMARIICQLDVDHSHGTMIGHRLLSQPAA